MQLQIESLGKPSAGQRTHAERGLCSAVDRNADIQLSKQVHELEEAKIL